MNDRLDAHVGENDEMTDAGRYCSETIEHNSDPASGICGAGQDVENR